MILKIMFDFKLQYMQLFQNVSFEQLMQMLMLKSEIKLTLTTYEYQHEL